MKKLAREAAIKIAGIKSRSEEPLSDRTRNLFMASLPAQLTTLGIDTIDIAEDMGYGKGTSPGLKRLANKSAVLGFGLLGAGLTNHFLVEKSKGVLGTPFGDAIIPDNPNSPTFEGSKVWLHEIDKVVPASQANMASNESEFQEIIKASEPFDFVNHAKEYKALRRELS